MQHHVHHGTLEDSSLFFRMMSGTKSQQLVMTHAYANWLIKRTDFNMPKLKCALVRDASRTKLSCLSLFSVQTLEDIVFQNLGYKSYKAFWMAYFSKSSGPIHTTLFG